MTGRDLTKLLAEHASRHFVPGAVLGILDDGDTTTAWTGLADVATGEPVTADTRFAVGSLTKSMVATVIARLAAAGGLSLEDSLAQHVPELRRVAWAERATIRDLLANRSRLPLRAKWEFSELADESSLVLSRLASTLATGAASAPVWSYTNVGWCLLGRVIETVTEGIWEDAMRANLLAPLGMDETTFATLPGAEPRAAGHDSTAEGPVRVEPWTPRSFGPAGSTVLSTAADLLRLASAHLDDPALSVLREIHADVRIHAWLDAWCLGWARFDSDGPSVWGWDGVISGQRAVLRLVPERRGAVVLLTNAGNGRAMYRSLLPHIMEASFGVTLPGLDLKPSPGAAGDLSRFTGVYAWPDRRWTVSAEGSHLLMEGNDRTMEAFPINQRTFLVDAADPDTPTVTFGAFDEAGRPGVLYQMLWGLPRV